MHLTKSARTDSLIIGSINLLSLEAFLWLQMHKNNIALYPICISDHWSPLYFVHLCDLSISFIHCLLPFGVVFLHLCYSFECLCCLPVFITYCFYLIFCFLIVHKGICLLCANKYFLFTYLKTILAGAFLTRLTEGSVRCKGGGMRRGESWHFD